MPHLKIIEDSFINLTKIDFFLNSCTEKTGHSIPHLSLSKTIQRDELQRDEPYGDMETISQVLDNQDILLCYSTFPGKE